ncbi:hypothetical protein CR513_54170, partial [Mucuna pruriens]
MATMMAATFDKFTLHYVYKRCIICDSSLATTQKRGVQRSIIHESIGQPTIEELTISYAEERKTWMSPLIEYLKDEQLPSDPIEAKKLVRDAAKYIIIGGELYRRGFSFPLLHCVEGEESQYVVKEVYEGVCDTHIGGRALASKIARAGYYWPTLKNNCMECCQRVVEVTTTPKAAALHHLTLAISQMGGGHPGIVPTNAKSSEVSDNGNRLLHEMNRG